MHKLAVTKKHILASRSGVKNGSGGTGGTGVVIHNNSCDKVPHQASDEAWLLDVLFRNLRCRTFSQPRTQGIKEGSPAFEVAQQQQVTATRCVQ